MKASELQPGDLFRTPAQRKFRKLNILPIRLYQMLKLANPAYQMHNTTTLPIQAGLAAAVKWEELAEFQQEMDEGK